MKLARLLSAVAAICLLACCGQLTAEKKNDLAVSDTVTVPTKDVLKISTEVQSRIGLETVVAGFKPDNAEISTTGEIKADENRIFHINSLANGRVVKDSVMLGDLIRPGQNLAVVQNLEVAKVYSNYIHQQHENEIQSQMSKTRLALARKSFDRVQRLFAEKISAEKDLIKAESDLRLEEETLLGLQQRNVSTTLRHFFEII